MTLFVIAKLKSRHCKTQSPSSQNSNPVIAKLKSRHCEARSPSLQNSNPVIARHEAIC